MPVALPVALLVGSAIAGGAQVASGVIGAHAAGSAADKQAAAAQQAADLAQTAGDKANAKIGDIFSQQQQLLSPYAAQSVSGLDALTQALAPGGTLSKQFSYNPADVSKDPAYQFQLEQGLNSVKRAQAATGTLASGGAAKALEQYSQGVAASYENQDYGQALSTYGTNRNAALTNIQIPLQAGEYGTSGLLSALQSYGDRYSTNTIGTAQTIGNDLTGKANAQASGIVGSANAYSGALSGLANTAQMLALFSTLGGTQGSAPNVGLPTGGTYNNLPALPAPAYPTAPAPSAFVNPLAGYGSLPAAYGSYAPPVWTGNQLAQ